MTKRKTTARAEDGIEKFPVSWRGIAIEISFERNWLDLPPSEFQSSHLEVRATEPGQQLPITETGYRSHFVAAEEIDEAGGAVAYVTAWLDEAANGKAWKAQSEARRQLSLF